MFSKKIGLLQTVLAIYLECKVTLLLNAETPINKGFRVF